MHPAPLPLPSATGRAIIRALSVSDLARFQAYRADPELARYQGWSPMSEREAYAFLEQMAAVTTLLPGAWIQLGITPADSSELAGDLGLWLDPDGKQAEIGFTLSRDCHGRGLACDAVAAAMDAVFSSSVVDSVRAITDLRNAASIRVLQRTGFRRVAQRTADFKGERCTELVFERARPT